jgi:hypothetical protein
MENHHFFHSYSNYLVGGLNLKNIGQLGLLWLIIPNIWKNKKMFQIPDHQYIYYVPAYLFMHILGYIRMSTPTETAIQYTGAIHIFSTTPVCEKRPWGDNRLLLPVLGWRPLPS